MGCETSGTSVDAGCATTGKPTVLVVEDEPALADVYAIWLHEDYEVEVVHTGESALETLRETTVEVVLLDRHLPDISGDEVLVALRDWGMDARVAMVTGVSPGFDVLDLGFDDYLLKPVDRETLLGTVDGLIEEISFDSLYVELTSLRVRRNVLRAELPESRLEANDRYVEVVERIEELERRESAYRAKVGGGFAVADDD